MALVRKSERHTESILDEILAEQGFEKNNIGYQNALDSDVQQYLRSKKNGHAGHGHPEITYRLAPRVVLVGECKQSTIQHGSKGILRARNLNECALDAEKYAEDGVVHYMRGLRQKFATVGVAVSGTDRSGVKVTVFRCEKNGQIERVELDNLPSPKKCLKLVKPPKAVVDKSLEESAEDLHNFLRDEMELSEQEKPLLVSAIMLALEVPSFRNSYTEYDSGVELVELMLNTIKSKLAKDRIPAEKVEVMMATYGFIRTNQPLRAHIGHTIATIHEEIWERMDTEDNIDILGEFYSEFLKYSGGDKKGLGIVLTPRHISSLFVKLARVTKQTVVLDTCAGTGSFLIAAMVEMLRQAKGDEGAIKRIKDEQLIGIEQNDRMFTLACANMLLRGDGKSNMFFGSCFNPETGLRINPQRTSTELQSLEERIADLLKEESTERENRRRSAIERQIRALQERRALLTEAAVAAKRAGVLKRVPDIAILNPPYAKKTSDKNELAFIYEACSLLRPGGLCVAIVPLSCTMDETAAGIEWKTRLLNDHTLDAVVSLPEQLFAAVGVVCCAMIFRTHEPHPKNYKSWLALWKDDGFRLKKGRRVEARPWNDSGEEEGTESIWVKAYEDRSNVPQVSIKKALKIEDEWCAEAHLEPDYKHLGEAAVRDAITKFALYQIQKVMGGSENASALSDLPDNSNEA